jgi:prepilin-type N-terminal cleavage/methylation domain-containing protein
VKFSVGNPKSGFTLVEVLIGMTLSLLVMGAVLSGYVYLAKNFTRSLGLSSATEPTLESQGRRTISYFVRDVRMASGIDPTLPDLPDTFRNTVKLILPASLTGNPTVILYYYNNREASSAYLHASGTIDLSFDASGVEFPSQSLTRVIMTTPRIFQVLHKNLTSCSFNYHDISGNPYTIFSPSVAGFSSLAGVKEIDLTFTSQGGSAINGTLTPVYASASPRLILRNKQLQP